MAIENFKPTLWEGSIMENFHDSSFVGLITTPPVDKRGEKVIFNRIQKGVWKEYTSGKPITWDQVATTKVELDFPKQKYFAFMVDDCDAVQTKGDVLKSVTKEQSGVLGEEVDQEVINFISVNVAKKNTIGTIEAPQLVKVTNAYDTLVDLNTMANKKKIPVTERYFIISPDYLALLEKDDRFTKEYKILQNGLLDGVTVNGNRIICKADNPADKVLLTHKSGTGYGMQLDGSAEAVRLQDYFADGVKGLVKYGYTELREESSFLAHIKYE
ncbi:hypothetical protein [Clostridium sporogenes]|uniref:hypothetical protein n=1 Tax=Clostridium sporogenes TaxID=1509 RepID=UPI0022375D80|nr:hypothetical protein [Clostridium sporogenes]MCW6111619.1 hypothetical protein [Clostridium sporogenes]